MDSFLFGRLTFDDIAIFNVFRDFSMNELVASGAGWLEVLAAVGVVGLLTYYRVWGVFWREWLCSQDHKKIGIMYMVIGFVMMARGVAEGVVMRAHLATALDGGILAPQHFAELFSTHGTIMIFFVAMPFIAGFMNFLIPLQIGARDMAFPLMNLISLGLTAAGAMMLLVSLVVGQFETGGWAAYPPFTGKAFQPGVGPDYWIWAIVVSGFGSMLSGINFAVTIYKMRAPGMTYMRMPVFCWTALCTAILLTFAMPPLTVAALMQALDRYLDFHFFTNDRGGNMMNYANLFWMFGHPEVYILILPAYGIFSELTATYSAKTLYGYASLVLATMCIAVMSFTVWVHHFFTMGNSATVNVAFGIATMLIAIPTGVKMYVWLATLWRGRVRLTVPMIYLGGFMVLFVLGGLSGIILANPTINYQVHNSQFIVAHFHNVILPGVVFAVLAGVHMWFPKAFGFRLEERPAKISAVLWIVGFSVTFLPLYFVGLLGYPRRSASYSDATFEPYMIVTALGSLIILAAFVTFASVFWFSWRNRAALAVPLGDPWDGRTLEWATPAPVPEYNFPVIPEVASREAFAVEKAAGRPYVAPDEYEDIHLPAPSAVGFMICVAAGVFSFAMVWWMWWLAALALLAIPTILVVRSFSPDRHIIIPAAQVKAETQAWMRAIDEARGVTRDEELTNANRGYARTDLQEAA
ncbi:cbb3-type cytochrome c oxidase subunit I [Acuticoccus sp. I52.16.1]|uniref:cbb3-type cytochrome c oxidase subunit I n=1 Tax=Acuticoccus sp. I52.16.1 TaxID=2928472 RepID=UPI001FCFA3C6|nr:cbb3-type cytochrome c oxidase subunit I [Acuticoccus sp. I52.16.1]UOM32745.1 cbb3-type cytochrome c oxidase subunit I [Acuticoccus sp. I52.16.1]